MFSQFGPLEIILVLVVLLVIFGPKRLPSLGRQLGTGMREFKDSITGDRRAEKATDDADAPAALGRPSSSTEPVGSAAEREPADVAPESRG
jgi:sec-independent protein translocase protein TatA